MTGEGAGDPGAQRRGDTGGHASTMTSSASHGTFTGRLFREWHWMCTRPQLLDHVRRWPLEGPPLTSLDDLLQRCGYGGRPDDEAADAVLARVLHLATFDTVATRVVLQRVLPGMLAIARRRTSRRPAEFETTLCELAGAMWLQIRSTPTDRSHHHVAAHLLRNAEYEAFRRSMRRVHHRREVPAGGSMAEYDLTTDPTALWLDDPGRRLAEALRHGHAAGLPRGDLDLITSLASGESVDAAAGRLGISDRALRARRAAAVARLREVVQAA